MDINSVSQTVQVVSVVAGVVISVLSFNAGRDKDLEARRLEAAKPFLELRQKLYLETLKTAAVLATPEERTKVDLAAARLRFRELYVAELSMVEPTEVEGQMKALAQLVDPSLIPLNEVQRSAYDLAHTLRNTFVVDWNISGGAARPAPLP